MKNINANQVHRLVREARRARVLPKFSEGDSEMAYILDTFMHTSADLRKVSVDSMYI